MDERFMREQIEICEVVWLGWVSWKIEMLVDRRLGIRLNLRFWEKLEKSEIDCGRLRERREVWQINSISIQSLSIANWKKVLFSSLPKFWQLTRHGEIINWIININPDTQKQTKKGRRKLILNFIVVYGIILTSKTHKTKKFP